MTFGSPLQGKFYPNTAPTYFPKYSDNMGAVVKRKKSYTKDKRPKKVSKQRIGAFKASPGSFQEKKWVDVNAVPTFTTTATVALLNGLVKGTDYYERIGHNYVNKSIRFKGHILVAGTDGTAVADTLAVVIVYDKQSNLVAPTWANVMQSTNNAGTLTSVPMSHFNIENSDRFLIIAHKTFSMPPYVLTASVPGAVGPMDPTKGWEFDIYKKLNLPTRCAGDTAGVGDILSGSIHVLTLGSQATADWQMTYSCRIRIDN